MTNLKKLASFFKMRYPCHSSFKRICDRTMPLKTILIIVRWDSNIVVALTVVHVLVLTLFCMGVFLVSEPGRGRGNKVPPIVLKNY